MASVATAFVALVPSADGFEGKLKRAIGPGLDNAGKEGGQTFGQSFGNKIKSMAGPLIAAFSATAVIGFAKAGVDAAVGFEKGIREVVTLTGSVGAAAAAEFEEFSAGVRGVSRELGIATDVLNQGLYNAISAGVPKDNVFDFMTIASKASVAGVTDVNTAVDGLTTIINAFGLDISEVESVSDSMFAAVQGGKTTFDELSRSIFQIGPAAAAAGVSFQEVNAGIATLTASGVPTSVATTQMRAALVGLQRPSEEMNKIFQALGYENAQLAIESEGLGFALTAVNDAADGNNGQLTTLLGSVEAVAAAQVIAGTGAEKYAIEMQRQADSVGATNVAFQEMEKSRTLERLGIAFDDIKLTIGTALLPAVETIARFLMNDLIPAFSEMGDWIQKNSSWLEPLVAILGSAAAALVVYRQAVSVATGIQTGYAAATYGVQAATYATSAAQKVGAASYALMNSAVAKNTAAVLANNALTTKTKLLILASTAATAIATAAQWAWNVAVTANPIGIIVVAIAALVAALVYFFTQTETGRQMWEQFMTGMKAAWDVLWSGLKTGLEALGAAFNFVWESVIKPVFDGFIIIVSLLAALFQFLWDNVIKPIVTWWIDYFKALGAVAMWLYNSAIKPVMDSIAWVFNWIWTSIIKPVFGWITDTFTQVGETVKDVFGGVRDFMTDTFNALVGIVKGPLNQIIGFINKVIEALNTISIDIPAWAPGPYAGKKLGFSIPRIPMLAEGGYVESATLAMIGEAGPEVVTPLADFERMMGMGEKSGQTMNYYAAPNQSLDGEQALFQAMRRARVVAQW
jgi:TP901 family phage tail tape measure protein